MQTEQKKIGLALFFLTLIAGTITLLVFFVAEDVSAWMKDVYAKSAVSTKANPAKVRAK